MKDIVVIDIESTGVDTDTNEIIGLSAVLIQSQKVTGLKYETWCNAPKDFDKEVLNIIGKKIGFFEDQPSLSDAIKDLGDFINSRRVVALNPTFCSALLYKSGLSSEIEIEDALTEWMDDLLRSGKEKRRRLAIDVLGRVEIELPWWRLLPLLRSPDLGDEVLDLLRMRTGRSYGPDPDAWRRYFQEL